MPIVGVRKSMISMENKRIIVTGAASGIGKAITIECINLGATVIAVDINKIELEILKKQIGTERIYTFTADISKLDQVEQIFDYIKKSGRFVNGLVNNAGIYYGKPIIEYTEEELDRVLAVNIKTAVYMSKEFAEYKIQNKEQGSIVNISSVAGLEGSSDAIYGLTKAALIGLTKSNAINFSPYIRVNAVAPGIVDTPMLKAIPKKRLDTYREKELIDEQIDPKDIAYTVVFLLSDTAKHYTGAVFDINNGCYLR